MTKKIFSWLGKEFVTLSSEAQSGTTASEQTRDLLLRFDGELKGMGLSLENTVRTRLWGRDRESRDLGGTERFKILSGRARSASSSYISPLHFDSGARVALDLLAMRPSQSDAEKILKEYDPPIVPLRYLIYDSVLFLSGVTTVLPELEDQVANILSRISASLTDAGSSWDRAVNVSFYLHRSQKAETLRELFRKTVQAKIPKLEYSWVDGYSAEGKLIEIETTAKC
jgi:enamine deaminase RidA (YjgF/YER057c/UK114 family)